MFSEKTKNRGQEKCETVSFNLLRLSNVQDSSLLHQTPPHPQTHSLVSLFTAPHQEPGSRNHPHPCNPHQQWEQSLQTHFSETQTHVSDVAHFVLDKIPNAELGFKFFDWAFRRPYCCPPTGSAYNSLLKRLAWFGVVSEIENVMQSMKVEDVKPSKDALSFVILAYADSGLVDKALELYGFGVDSCGSVPSVYACNALLMVL
ncbi:hypothetical protein ACLB2K_066575 [Fragaria x ananassa]